MPQDSGPPSGEHRISGTHRIVDPDAVPRSDASQSRMRTIREADYLRAENERLEKELEVLHAKEEQWFRRKLGQAGAVKVAVGAISFGVVVVLGGGISWQMGLATKHDVAEAKQAAEELTTQLRKDVASIKEKQEEDRAHVDDFSLVMTAIYNSVRYSQELSLIMVKHQKLAVPPAPPLPEMWEMLHHRRTSK